VIRELEAQHKQARRSLRCRWDRAEGTYASQRRRRGSHISVRTSALWFVNQAETLVVADSLGRDASECRHLAGGNFDASAEESLGYHLTVPIPQEIAAAELLRITTRAASVSCPQIETTRLAPVAPVGLQLSERRRATAHGTQLRKSRGAAP
jgi:hypothetical protein